MKLKSGDIGIIEGCEFQIEDVNGKFIWALGDGQCFISHLDGAIIFDNGLSYGFDFSDMPNVSVVVSDVDGVKVADYLLEDCAGVNDAIGKIGIK